MIRTEAGPADGEGITISVTGDRLGPQVGGLAECREYVRAALAYAFLFSQGTSQGLPVQADFLTLDVGGVTSLDRPASLRGPVALAVVGNVRRQPVEDGPNLVPFPFERLGKPMHKVIKVARASM